MFINFFSLLIFFFLSKEVLFYGEERLIVISYLSLFVVLFFFLGASLVEDFKYRSNILKEEFDNFFLSIINLLVRSRSLVLKFSFLFVNIKKIFVFVLKEFLYFSLLASNYSCLKFNFFNVKFNCQLNSSVLFYNKFSNIVNLVFFKELVAQMLRSYYSNFVFNSLIVLGSPGSLTIKNFSFGKGNFVVPNNLLFLASNLFKLPESSVFRYNFNVSKLSYTFYSKF